MEIQRPLTGYPWAQDLGTETEVGDLHITDEKSIQEFFRRSAIADQVVKEVEGTEAYQVIEQLTYLEPLDRMVSHKDKPSVLEDLTRLRSFFQEGFGRTGQRTFLISLVTGDNQRKTASALDTLTTQAYQLATTLLESCSSKLEQLIKNDASPYSAEVNRCLVRASESNSLALGCIEASMKASRKR